MVSVIAMPQRGQVMTDCVIMCVLIRSSTVVGQLAGADG